MTKTKKEKELDSQKFVTLLCCLFSLMAQWNHTWLYDLPL